MHLSAWFRALLIAVMLLTCCVACFHAYNQALLHSQIDDLTLMLHTSRQREAKQQHEYDQAAAALPEVQKALEEAQPLAEAAKAREEALRAQRKQLRAEVAALQSAIDSEWFEYVHLLLQLAQTAADCPPIPSPAR